MTNVDQEEIKHKVCYEIDTKVQKTKLLEGRLKEIMNVVKEHNPALLALIQKGSFVPDN
jgi:hypothetical protein